MKKTYQNPAIVVVNIQTMNMIAESIGVGNAYKSGDDVLSRRGNSDWDDEE